MKRLLLISFLFSQFINGFSQDYWKSYRQKEGLLDSNIVDLAVSDEAVYLATEKGFSIFRNEQFMNFDSTNSSLPRNSISKVRQYNDSVYIVTDSGITRYVKGRFKNFNSQNGLFNEEVQDIEINSKGEVIIGSFSGILKLNGDQIDTLSNSKCYDLGVNSGDTIYANVSNPSIVNFPGAPVSCEVFDGSTWQAVSDTVLRNALANASFVSLSNGRVGIVTTNNDAYRVDSLFSLTKYTLPTQLVNPTNLRSMDIGLNGSAWFALSTQNPFDDIAGGLYRFGNSNPDLYLVGLPNSGVNKVIQQNGKIYIGTLNGFAVANDSLEPFSLEMKLSTNQVEANFMYTGQPLTGLNQSPSTFSNGFEFPKGSGKYVNYGMGLWNYGVSDIQDSILAVQEYDIGDYTEGSINQNEQMVRPNMFYIDRFTVIDHVQNYQSSGYAIPDEIKNWPAQGLTQAGESNDMAPFVDVDQNGCYEPEKGDYPYFLGDKALYIIFNDAQQPRTGQFTPNFNMEIHLMAYVFNQPNIEYLEQSVFLRYTLINRSSRVYQMNSGFFQDLDLGNPINDYVGCLPASDIYYGYNATAGDGTQQGAYNGPVPAFGTKLINRKLESFADRPFSGERARPNTYLHYIRAFEKRWNNGIPYTSGGNGYDPSSTATTSFLYSGDPRKSNEWSERFPGVGLSANAAGDRAILAGIEPYEFRPGQRKTIDLVVGVGIDSSLSSTDWLDNIDVLVNNLNQAAQFQKAVDSLSADFVYANCTVGLNENESISNQTELVVYPNPSTGEFNLVSSKKVNQIRLYDLQGKEVQRIVVDSQTSLMEISFKSELPNGLYVIQALTQEGKPLNAKVLLQR
ncbi:MAG: T9SS type A sorting domain-containing protein [Vicingaceae bacterium]